MDPQRLKDAYYRIEALDERLTYKINPRSGGSMVRPSVEQLDDKIRDLATYTIELKSILREVCLAFAKKPAG